MCDQWIVLDLMSSVSNPLGVLQIILLNKNGEAIVG
jgi:hypothetical protein